MPVPMLDIQRRFGPRRLHTDLLAEGVATGTRARPSTRSSIAYVAETRRSLIMPAAHARWVAGVGLSLGLGDDVRER